MQVRVLPRALCCDDQEGVKTSTMTARVVIGLCLAVWACSSGSGPAPVGTTVLFSNTNPGAIDVFARATDTTTSAALDTILPVPAGGQACLRVSAGRLQSYDVVKLELTDGLGHILAIAYVTPGFWRWDGSTGNATPAPPC